MGKALELTQLPSFVVANSTTMTVNAFNFTVGSGFIANSTAVIVGNTSVGWFGFGETTPVSTRAFNIKRSWTTDSTAMTSFSNTIINDTTLTAPRGYYGQWNVITSNILDANSSGGIQGSDVYGTYTYALNGSVGGDARINTLTGIASEVRNQAGGATANTVDVATGSISKVIQSSSGITTQAVGVKSQIYAANNSVTGNVTSAFGFSSLIQSNTAMTVGTGYLYHGTYQGSTTTTRYGLYITGEANNYLSGNLSVAGAVKVGSSGITFSDASVQTTAAVGGSAPVVTIYTANTTWTKPATIKAVKVTVVSGGGGGGGSYLDSNPGVYGGGGGGGGGGVGWFPAPTIPGPVAVTVGVGGAGGTAGRFTSGGGGTGGSSSFGSLITATGGSGGSSGGGAAGSVTSGPTVIGYRGTPGSGGAPNVSGAGGNSFQNWGFGAPGVPGPSNSGNPASDGYGSGGGGASSASGPLIGGTGRAGFIVVEEFY